MDQDQVTDDGDNRFVYCCRDPGVDNGPAAPTHGAVPPERVAKREAVKVRDGAWHDHSSGQVTFADYGTHLPHRVWSPAVKASGVDLNLRVHDLRHPHASWLLAGGSDLKSVWTAWATPRSPPPRNTSKPPPTSTPRTSTP